MVNPEVNNGYDTESESETCPWCQQIVRGSGVEVGPTPDRSACSNTWTFHEECSDHWEMCIVRLERLAREGKRHTLVDYPIRHGIDDMYQDP